MPTLTASLSIIKTGQPGLLPRKIPRLTGSGMPLRANWMSGEDGSNTKKNPDGTTKVEGLNRVVEVTPLNLRRGIPRQIILTRPEWVEAGISRFPPAQQPVKKLWTLLFLPKRPGDEA